MKYEIENMPTELINCKVKIALSSFGLNERYNAFEYLSFIITYMIKSTNDSTKTYNEAVDIIENKFNITKSAVNYGLNRIINKCLNTNISNKTQFNLNSNGIINRVRVMKNFALESF